MSLRILLEIFGREYEDFFKMCKNMIDNENRQNNHIMNKEERIRFNEINYKPSLHLKILNSNNIGCCNYHK